MTNKPMLSVERELLELFVSDVEAHNYGFDGLEEMRALLDEPVDHPNLGIEMMRGAGSGILIQDHGAGWQAVTFNRGVRVSSFPIKGGYKEAVAALEAAQQQGVPPLIATLHENGELIAAQATIAQQAKLIELLKGKGQGQGEPVLFVCPDDLTNENFIGISGKFKRDTVHVQPLYAEQPAPVAVVMPEILHQTIRDTLRNYRMSTLDDGHGGGYPLIDAMTADGQPVSGGIEECQYLADAILNACIDEVSRLNGVKP